MNWFPTQFSTFTALLCTSWLQKPNILEKLYEPSPEKPWSHFPFLLMMFAFPVVELLCLSRRLWTIFHRSSTCLHTQTYRANKPMRVSTFPLCQASLWHVATQAYILWGIFPERLVCHRETSGVLALHACPNEKKVVSNLLQVIAIVPLSHKDVFMSRLFVNETEKVF